MELLNQYIHGLGSLNTSLQGKQPALLKFDKMKKRVSQKLEQNSNLGFLKNIGII
jgi:hypothetical protein